MEGPVQYSPMCCKDVFHIVSCAKRCHWLGRRLHSSVDSECIQDSPGAYTDVGEHSPGIRRGSWLISNNANAPLHPTNGACAPRRGPCCNLSLNPAANPQKMQVSRWITLIRPFHPNKVLHARSDAEPSLREILHVLGWSSYLQRE